MRSARRGVVVVSALAAWVALLGGCTEAPTVTRSTTPPTATSAPSSSRPENPGPPVDLAQAKKAAGIKDCPTSDAKVAVTATGLPDAVLRCLGGGRPVRLAGLRGQPTIINVWAQWCQPCRQEAPYVSDVARSGSGQVRFLGIDYRDPRPDLAIEFARLSSWTYPQLTDDDQVLAQTMQITAPPITLFVRADGTVAGRHAGAFTSAAQIRQLSQQYLGVTP